MKEFVREARADNRQTVKGSALAVVARLAIPNLNEATTPQMDCRSTHPAGQRDGLTFSANLEQVAKNDDLQIVETVAKRHPTTPTSHRQGACQQREQRSLDRVTAEHVAR